MSERSSAEEKLDKVLTGVKERLMVHEEFSDFFTAEVTFYVRDSSLSGDILISKRLRPRTQATEEQ